MTLSVQSLGRHGYRSAWAVQVAALQAMKALWDGRLGACQGAAKAAAPVKGAAAKATKERMRSAAQQFTCAARSPGQPLWDGRLGRLFSIV